MFLEDNVATVLIEKCLFQGNKLSYFPQVTCVCVQKGTILLQIHSKYQHFASQIPHYFPSWYQAEF